MDFSILDTIYKICPNDPAKAMTYIKECLIAEDLNLTLGTAYEAQLNCAYEGVDLLDRHSPPVQSKTTQSLRYECGSTLTVNEIAQKAINVNEQALVSFAQIKGSQILQHVFGPARLLLDFRTRTGRLAHGISFAQLRKLGFTDARM